MDLKEDPDGWIPSIQGWTVTRCQVDYSFTLQFQPEDTETVYIRLEQPFQVIQAGQQWTLSAATDPVGLSPALGVLRQTVQRAHISHAGVLTLTFANGIQIQALPDPHGNYESWQLASDTVSVVCLPSGGLAMW